jgi:hypothetical protein
MSSPTPGLLGENKRRTRNDPEFELMDTGIFDKDEYFDVFTEYAKNAQDDILIKITIHNRSDKDAAINVMPTLWFRNTWSWGYDPYKPSITANGNGVTGIFHKDLGQLWLHAEGNPQVLFCDNETNMEKLI